MLWRIDHDSAAVRDIAGQSEYKRLCIGADRYRSQERDTKDTKHHGLERRAPPKLLVHERMVDSTRVVPKGWFDPVKVAGKFHSRTVPIPHLQHVR